MSYSSDFKKKYAVGSILDLVVSLKIFPGVLVLNLSNNIKGTLHVSELNWNFGLCQTDFRNIKVGSKLRVYIVGFDNRNNNVQLGRKNLQIIAKPSQSVEWKQLVLKKEITATVFEEYRNKVIIKLDIGLFGTIPLLKGKSYKVGTKIKVVPVTKNVKQNIIECTLQEFAESEEEQSIKVIENFKKQTPENNFLSSESFLNSFPQLSKSLYWNYFSKEDQDTLKILFEETENLFSKVEKGEDPLYIEFDFGYPAYNYFIKIIAPEIFNFEKLSANLTDKDSLIELSKFNFWYTQYEKPNKKTVGLETKVVEKVFTLFNEMISIQGIVSDEGSLKIRFIKAKHKPESLRDKQSSLRFYDVFYVKRPIIFSQFASANTVNRNFVQAIDNKITALKIFEVAKTKSLDILQHEGKEFKIFSNYLESQIDFEEESANDTELQIKECKLELEVQADGITFIGTSIEECEMQIDDKVAISNRTKEEKLQNLGSGTVLSVDNRKIKIKSNIGNFELVRDGCFIKRISSIKQYLVQLDVLNKFFSNKLPLDTFYQVFHDKEGIEPPDVVDLSFYNEIFKGKENPQTIAIKKAIGNKNILLIQGPPGTGKTTVIAEIVKQLISRGEKLLVTSQTHIAVDNVLERIKDDTEINIARIGHEDSISEFAAEFQINEARKKFSEKVQKIVDIKVELLNQYINGTDISVFSKQNFELPLIFNWENIQRFILLIQGLELKQIYLFIETLDQWKEVISKSPKLLTNLFLQRLNVLFGTCIGIATNRELSASELVFDTVILDEAGKANISESLTAISKARKIILVGDHKQLPPYLDKERVEYFKKFSKDFANQITSDDEIKQALGASFFEYLQRDGVLNSENKILLSEQHRMHPDIGNFVSQSFYNSELRNGVHTKENVIPLPEPFDKQIIFIDTSSDKSSSESFIGGSYFNQVEAEFIVNKIISELKRNDINPKSFAIVSPYSKQCEKIKLLLLERNPDSPKSFEVATLDSFQGREYDIIIFSFTRSSIDKMVGFLDDARRLNVAFSRARKKLILVGNAETLKSPRSHYDSYYTNLFQKLWLYASKYGKTYRINELDYRKLKTNIQVGNVIKATVKRFESYGVLVDVGNQSGLIPIKELCWNSVKTPNDILELNQKIDVKIIRINEKGILLSLKETTPKSFQSKNLKEQQLIRKKKESKIDLFNNEFKIFDVVEVTIIRIVVINSNALKVFAEMKYGIPGMFIASFSEKHKMKTGTKVKVIIEKIDFEKQIVKCKLKL